jgi:PII-like signaling protein
MTAARENRVRAFLDAIDPLMGSGLVTLEKVKVIRYGPRRRRALSPRRRSG